MYHKSAPFKVKNGAIIVSDVHFNSEKRGAFFFFLEDINNSKINTKQLILLGDIFDLLFAPIDTLVQRDKKIIDLLNCLAKKIEVIYFEGNHDFCLDSIFENIRIIPLQEQPLETTANKQTIFLAHGDYGLDVGYKIYTTIIRNSMVLKFLNFLNKLGSNFIVNSLDRHLDKKDHCHKFDNFEAYIKRRIGLLHIKKESLFIEGHHHQGKSVDVAQIKYSNLEAFACNQRFYSVQFCDEKVTLSVNTFRHSTE